MGVHCVKWCSNGQKHKTVLRLVEIGERKYVAGGTQSEA